MSQPTTEELLAKVREVLDTDAKRWETVLGHIRKIQNNLGGASVYDFGEDTFAQMSKHILGLRELANLAADHGKATNPHESLAPKQGRVSLIEME